MAQNLPGEIRSDEKFDEERLTRYLQREVPELEDDESDRRRKILRGLPWPAARGGESGGTGSGSGAR